MPNFSRHQTTFWVTAEPIREVLQQVKAVPTRPGGGGRPSQSRATGRTLRCRERRLTVPQSLGLADITLEGVVPRYVILPLGEILFVLDDEPDALQRLSSVVVPPHLGNPIPELDLVCDLAVFRVGSVVTVGHDPFVNSKDTTGLEDLEDLAVDALESRSVAGSLDSVD